MLLIEGPSSKRSNPTRVAWAARELLGASNRPCFVQRVADFEDDSLVNGLLEGISRLDGHLREPAQHLVIHTGTDRAGAAIARWLVANDWEVHGRKRRVSMIGFDGLRTPDGALLIDDIPGMIATVDQQPYLLGAEAAAHLVSAFRGELASRPREVTVKPKISRAAGRSGVKL
jgi:hypothetical protein